MVETMIGSAESQAESASNESARLPIDDVTAPQRYRFAAALVPFVLLASSVSITTDSVSLPSDVPGYTSTTQHDGSHYLTMIGRPVSLLEARQIALASLLKAEKEREEAAASEARFWGSLDEDA